MRSKLPLKSKAKALLVPIECDDKLFLKGTSVCLWLEWKLQVIFFRVRFNFQKKTKKSFICILKYIPQ